jgi:hypothetical protein
MHRRADQASFRRRYFTYRHYAFNGTWELKGQAVIESGPTAYRELFLVLPGDLIEFQMRYPDCNTAIEIKSLGYIKKGSIEELKKWLAYNVYLERPAFRRADPEARRNHGDELRRPGSPYGHADIIMRPIHYLRHLLGFSWL